MVHVQTIQERPGASSSLTWLLEDPEADDGAEQQHTAAEPICGEMPDSNDLPNPDLPIISCPLRLSPGRLA